MRQLLVAGNWKMNGNLSSICALAQQIKTGIDGNDIQLAVFPPSVYLPEVRRQLAASTIAWGAQDVSDQVSGPFTGELSASMLLDFHCRYTLVGHSERRQRYGESDLAVAKKFAAARQSGLVPVLCIGETLAERERALTESVVERQLRTVLNEVGVEGFEQAVIAYEPVWAIGTGKTATPSQAQAVHACIRRTLTECDAKIGASTQILYGGSVNGSNAAELFKMPDIDGGLIGGASLDAGKFLDIVKAAESVSQAKAA